MTYIIAGRIRNANFMMSECIATDKGHQSFAEKTIELKSFPGTFFALTGVSFVGDCLQTLDMYYQAKGLKLDLVNDINSLKSLLLYIEKATETSPYKPVNLKSNRLFFVSNGGVFYIDLLYKQSRLVNEPKVMTVHEGHFVDSSIQFGSEEIKEQNLPESEIRDFCLKHIHNLSARFGFLDFKGRYNFVMFVKGSNPVIESPFKYPSDILAWMNKLPFGMIDDDDFKFNLIE